ncbi:hypothetical protein G8O23_16020 [Bacteroidales bacterium M08MB]|nr:hypothetical protein [Perlabentimonas gracilis]
MVTFNRFDNILQALQAQGFSFITFGEYMELGASEGLTSSQAFTTKQIILRHDVDLLPQNSLATAKLEHELGIKGSYYFRAVPQSWDEQIIREIAALGHEVGYHYENLTICNGNIEEAYTDFTVNLYRLRQLTNVTTICMHGSPTSRYDSKDIWKHYSYRDLGIIGEPYFDMDFDHFFYLTDTGRRWDGWRTSVRDRVPQQERWIKEGLVFKTTSNIIKAAHSGKLPPQIMITVHPQSWSSSAVPWLKELVLQNVKNLVKRVIIGFR